MSLFTTLVIFLFVACSRLIIAKASGVNVYPVTIGKYLKKVYNDVIVNRRLLLYYQDIS